MFYILYLAFFLFFLTRQGEDKVQLAGLRPQDYGEAVLPTGDHRGPPPQRRQLHKAAPPAQRSGHAGGQQPVPVHHRPGGEVQQQGRE